MSTSEFESLVNLRAWSNAVVNQPREEAGIDDEIAKFGIKGGRGLGCDCLIARAPLPLECRNVVADCDQHVAEFLEFGFGADSFAVAGDDDGVVVCRREISV